MTEGKNVLNCRVTCWFVLSATGCVDLRLLARRAEKPNSRLKMFRPIRAMICSGFMQSYAHLMMT